VILAESSRFVGIEGCYLIVKGVFQSVHSIQQYYNYIYKISIIT